jgi:hypothetical protein
MAVVRIRPNNRRDVPLIGRDTPSIQPHGQSGRPAVVPGLGNPADALDFMGVGDVDSGCRGDSRRERGKGVYELDMIHDSISYHLTSILKPDRDGNGKLRYDESVVLDQFPPRRIR